MVSRVPYCATSAGSPITASTAEISFGLHSVAWAKSVATVLFTEQPVCATTVILHARLHRRVSEEGSDCQDKFTCVEVREVEACRGAAGSLAFRGIRNWGVWGAVGRFDRHRHLLALVRGEVGRQAEEAAALKLVSCTSAATSCAHGGESIVTWCHVLGGVAQQLGFAARAVLRRLPVHLCARPVHLASLHSSRGPRRVGLPWPSSSQGASEAMRLARAPSPRSYTSS